MLIETTIKTSFNENIVLVEFEEDKEKQYKTTWEKRDTKNN